MDILTVIYRINLLKYGRVDKKLKPATSSHHQSIIIVLRQYTLQTAFTKITPSQQNHEIHQANVL